MQNVLDMYSKAPLGDTSPDYPSLVLLYTDAALRFGQFMFAIWASKGWGSMAFLTMLSGTIPPAVAASFNSEPGRPPLLLRPSKADLFRLTSRTTISRSQIATISGFAHGPWLLHLQPPDRLRVLSALAQIYSFLGFERKEAYVLRELLSVIMDMIVVAREESRDSLMTGGGSVTAALGGFPAFVGGSGGGPGIGVAVREHETTEGNQSLLRVVQRVCEVHGVDLDVVKLLYGPAKEEGGGAITNDSEDDGLMLGSTSRSEPAGWAELQVGVVREAVAIAESLPGKTQSEPSRGHLLI